MYIYIHIYLGAKTLSLLIVELLDQRKFVATELWNLIYPIRIQVYSPKALKYFSVLVKLLDMKDLRCTSFASGMKLWKVKCIANKCGIHFHLT